MQRRRDNASVKTLRTNHIRVYLPERVTSHPQSWSCSAVWARFCGNMHRLYMPFIWHLTIAMTRDCKKSCHMPPLSSSHWLKTVPALSQTLFRVLGQWFSTPQIAISDIIAALSTGPSSSLRGRLLFRETSVAQGKPPSKKENPLSPKNVLKHLVPSPSSRPLRPWSR